MKDHYDFKKGKRGGGFDRRSQNLKVRPGSPSVPIKISWTGSFRWQNNPAARLGTRP